MAAPVLAACPQLRDGDFTLLPAARAGAGGATLDPYDAGVAGASGGSESSGGSAGSAGTGGLAGGPSDGADASASALATALAHRYGFEGTGNVAVDSIAGADAALIDVSLTGTGSVELAGSGQFVDLPDGLLSAADEQTLEAWLTWNGGRAWQRIFDFGSNDEDGAGETYLFLTPRSSRNVVTVSFTTTGYPGETVLDGTAPLPSGVPSHVAVVVDGTNGIVTLYIDGAWNAAAALGERISDVDDVNSWLGQSQYESDPTLNASLTEFRMYHRALTSDELLWSFERGPNAAL